MQVTPTFELIIKLHVALNTTVYKTTKRKESKYSCINARKTATVCEFIVTPQNPKVNYSSLNRIDHNTFIYIYNKRHVILILEHIILNGYVS